MKPEIVQAAELFKVLASPVRVAVLLGLTEGPVSVSDLAENLGVTHTLMSQHLRVLRMSGLVRSDLDGRTRRYSLTDDHVSHIIRDAVHHAAEEHRHDDH
ncbi:metalloregulator ArsR/SmtB family transcription factor [Micrococcus sp.]|uniref:ArsR/SmtB family transcription factor n=1 Tax=Micrococcus sp. TaxID=1271 RepID=UPI002A90C2B5|nr:metalloregulator ArsR/SmtB family transcription factor [Micrococcus sp.]MDY6054952.1 metalloregulator ArsR/SmtB family transcription factor [Micrococcus sp.]